MRSLTAATLAAASAASSQTVIFSETEFDPADWNAPPSFFSVPVDPGQTQSVSTARFISGNPANGFLIQQFTVDIPMGFTAAYAPVFMNGWSYDPFSNGAIESISFSMQTLNVSDLTPSFGTARVFLVQDGRLYVSGSFGGLAFDDTDQFHLRSGAIETDFVEFIDGVGFDLDSHPDFAGAEIAFGFGTSLTSTFISGQGTLTRAIGIDDVSFRIQTVPAPGVAAAGLAGLVLTRRRRA